jgi:hypothetical protein
VRRSAATRLDGGESWAILSPVEQGIKRKIEAVGVPLKDWGVSIYRGVLTGYNEAFIISGAKKDELIAADPKSAEIIRPILRGRDIKRYGYNFAELWVILAKFGSHKYLKNDYPAIFAHLKQYETQLTQRGQCRYNASGKVNKDKPYPGQHHWLELDNNPSDKYLEDFSKQKIIYPNMTKFLPFYLDNSNFFTNDKSFIIVGNRLAFLCAFLNSSIFKYCFMNNFPELGDDRRELRKIFFDKIPVKIIDEGINADFEKIVYNIQHNHAIGNVTKDEEVNIDNILFDIYGLSQEEKKEIGFIEIR